MVNLIYAGVGSRQTPLFVRSAMTKAAYQMSQHGWHLRSGYAHGADQAFGLGAAQHADESDIDRWTMYLPWAGYNNAPYGDERFVVPEYTAELQFEANCAHPNWKNLSDAVRKLMVRNVAIVLGPMCDEPVDMVLCWTSEGKGEGGTGHAMRVAKRHDIPVFDLALEADRTKASEFVYDTEGEYWRIPW